MRRPQMSNADRAALREGMRERAYGQGYQPSPVDRLGVWLSARQIRRYAGSLAGKQLGDFGCGYHAAYVRTVLSQLERAVIVDSALAPDLKSYRNVTAIEGTLPGVLDQVPVASLDIVLCISNVPTWRGKRFLEYSAFRLGLSPKDEMDDHKAYYDVKDFWPLLVRAGFRPSNIRCFSYKLGLNTFAICRSHGGADITT